MTIDTYDRTLRAMLRRLNTDLYDEACAAIGLRDDTTGKVQFRTPQLLHFLEHSWRVAS